MRHTLFYSTIEFRLKATAVQLPVLQFKNKLGDLKLLCESERKGQCGTLSLLKTIWVKTW